MTGSRWGINGSNISFEAYNDTGADLSVKGLVAAISPAAYYEKVHLMVLGDQGKSLAAVDYGIVWQYGTTRAGSGTSITFATGTDGTPNRLIGRDRQVLVELKGFHTAGSGGPSISNTDTYAMSVKFTDSAGVALAPTEVPLP